LFEVGRQHGSAVLGELRADAVRRLVMTRNLNATSGARRPRQRCAPCTKTGNTNAASIIANVERPLIVSHSKASGVEAARAIADHRPALTITRGSALSSQPPICAADTKSESPSIA
jgi:hypothetical protein